MSLKNQTIEAVLTVFVIYFHRVKQPMKLFKLMNHRCTANQKSMGEYCN